MLLSNLTEKYHPIRKDDMSKLANVTMDALRKTMNIIAKNYEVTVVDPLDLVHKTYMATRVQRPTPSMRAAWEQYEEMITMAVKLFHKFRQ
jgi:predicted alternative tryptophan synthase beta-subunit